MTEVAAPRCINRYSSELPPSVKASTDQAIAPASSAFHTMGADSRPASGNITTTAAISCTALALRTSQGATKRFWYRVPAVMDNKASTTSARLVRSAWSPALPWENLRDTTSSRPVSPSSNPSHWRRATLAPRADNHNAVSTGCRPTISADSPEPMPALTAAQTPPRYSACIKAPVTARCKHCRRPLGQATLDHQTQSRKHASDKAKRKARNLNGGACGMP